MFGHFYYQLVNAQLIESVIDERNCDKDRNQHYFVVFEAGLDNVAVKVKYTAVKLTLGKTFIGSLYSSCYIVNIFVQSFFEFSIRGEDQLGIEVVAVYIDLLALTDLSGEKDDAIFQCHGEGDLVFLKNVKDTFEYYVM